MTFQRSDNIDFAAIYGASQAQAQAQAQAAAAALQPEEAPAEAPAPYDPLADPYAYFSVQDRADLLRARLAAQGISSLAGLGPDQLALIQAKVADEAALEKQLRQAWVRDEVGAFQLVDENGMPVPKAAVAPVASPAPGPASAPAPAKAPAAAAAPAASTAEMKAISTTAGTLGGKALADYTASVKAQQATPAAPKPSASDLAAVQARAVAAGKTPTAATVLATAEKNAAGRVTQPVGTVPAAKTPAKVTLPEKFK